MTKASEIETESASDPVLDAPLSSARLAFVDLEMTGLDPSRDAIVEIAVVRRRGAAIEQSYCSLVHSRVEVSSAAESLHGLATAQLVAAPTPGSVLAEVVRQTHDCVIVGHGTAMDEVFLTRALDRAGLAPIAPDRWVDTLTLARRSFAAESFRLSSLATALALPPRRWHRALDDALGVADVFDAVVRALDARTARELREVHVGQRGTVVIRQRIAAALGALATSGASCTLVVRTPGRGEQAVSGTIERWASPHVWLARGHGGGVRVLRADRILRIE